MGVVTSAGAIAILLPGLRRIDRQPIAARRMTDAHSARAHGTPEQIRQQRRRADALALLTESSVRSYPSWIAELRRKSPTGVNRRRYAGEHIRAGDALELVRQSADPRDRHAVAYYHRGVHLGFVPSDTTGSPRRWTTGFASPQSPRRSRSDGFSAVAPNSSAPASLLSTTVANGPFGNKCSGDVTSNLEF